MSQNYSEESTTPPDDSGKEVGKSDSKEPTTSPDDSSKEAAKNVPKDFPKPPDDPGREFVKININKDKISIKVRDLIDINVDKTGRRKASKAETEAERKDQKQFKLIGIIIGAVLSVTFLILITLIPRPTDIQAGFYKIILALAGGALSPIFTGSIKVHYKAIIATGSSLIFAIIFFKNPALLPGGKPYEKRKFKGTFFVNNKLKSGLHVLLPQFSRNDTTNEMGIVEFEIQDSDPQMPLDIECIYKNILDTTFTIKSFTPTCRLVCDPRTPI